MIYEPIRPRFAQQALTRFLNRRFNKYSHISTLKGKRGAARTSRRVREK